MTQQFPRFDLRPDYSISRVIKGHWQLSEGHLLDGSHDARQMVRSMASFVEAGATTFDMADIYTGAEELVGRFLKENQDAFSNGNLPPVQIHTKYVPDLSKLNTVSFEDTELIVDRSLSRLGVEQLDLVQFHWWDYDVPRYIEVAHHLADLQKAGKIRHLGVTNFDTDHLAELVDSGLNIISAQVQYSVLDRRPERKMASFCAENNISLLCYGALSGGFLSAKRLNQTEENYRTTDPKNRSQTKYGVVIGDIGWDNYQAILRTLSDIGKTHNSGPGEVGIAYILTRPAVGATIVGAYSEEHLKRLNALSSLELSAEEIEQIELTLASIPTLEGDCFDLERYSPRHRDIMKFNLNDSKDSSPPKESPQPSS